MKNTSLTDEHGVERWFNENGELHHDDGPAIIHHWFSTKKWVPQRPKFIIFTKLANILLPSIFPKHIKDQYWYKNGKLHREDGPASIENNGTIITYYQEGMKHRIDGPAVVLKIKDVLLSESWYINNKLHRDGAPAFLSNEGNEYWYKNGEIHREDGPAAIDKNKKMWYKNGQLHRINGPAIEIKPDSSFFEAANIEYFYFLNGEGYSEHDFYKVRHSQKLDKDLPNKGSVEKRMKI